MTGLNRDYLALLKRLPLRRIRNELELDAAAELIEELSERMNGGGEMSVGQRDYVEAMSVLISDWKKHSPRIRAMMQEFEYVTRDGT